MNNTNASNDFGLYTEENRSTGIRLGCRGNGTDRCLGVTESVTTIILAIGLVSIDFLAFIGNILVIIAVYSHRRLRTITNLFVVSLASADLLLSVLVLPLAIFVVLTGRWPFGQIVCDMWVTFDVLMCTASILNLCCISVDRYFAITRPLVYATKRSKRLATIMIGVVWAMSAVITCPPIFGWKESGRSEQSDQCYLTTDPGYIIYSACGSFFIPMFVMLFIYLKIYRVVLERHKRLQPYRDGMYYKSSTCRCHWSGSVNDDAGIKYDDDMNISKQESQIPSTRTTFVSTALSPRSNGVSAADSAIEPGTRRMFQTTTSPKWHRRGSPNRDSRYTSIRSNHMTLIVKPNGGGTNNQEYHSDDKRVEKTLLMKEGKTAKSLAIVVGGFVVCWLPFFTIYIIGAFCASCVYPLLFSVITWLGYLNSCINPMIYAFCNRDFRYAFWKLTFGMCIRRPRTL